MNDSNEICESRADVNASNLRINRYLNKRSKRTNNLSPRRSKRTKDQPKNNRPLSSPVAMGSLMSADSTTNELNSQNIQSNEGTVVLNESQNEQAQAQTNEANNVSNVCIDLTEDDSVVNENNVESDSEVQCISTVIQNSELCIIRDIKRRNRLNRSDKSSNRRTAQTNDLIEIQDSQTANNSSSGVSLIQKMIKCPVCLDEFSTFRESGKQLVSTNCGHLFCDRCIKEVIKTSKSCPNCRKKIATQKSFHPIFL